MRNLSKNGAAASNSQVIWTSECDDYLELISACMCHTGDILCVNREDNMQLRKTYIWVPLCQLPSKPQSFSKMQLCPLMSPKCQWRSNSNAPIKQMIVLTVFSMGISLKWVSNMGYSLYLVDPYESLLHAMVKKKKSDLKTETRPRFHQVHCQLHSSGCCYMKQWHHSALACTHALLSKGIGP